MGYIEENHRNYNYPNRRYYICAEHIGANKEILFGDLPSRQRDCRRSSDQNREDEKELFSSQVFHVAPIGEICPVLNAFSARCELSITSQHRKARPIAIEIKRIFFMAYSPEGIIIKELTHICQFYHKNSKKSRFKCCKCRYSIRILEYQSIKAI